MHSVQNVVNVASKGQALQEVRCSMDGGYPSGAIVVATLEVYVISYL